jgi:hypothetical protein
LCEFSLLKPCKDLFEIKILALQIRVQRQRLLLPNRQQCFYHLLQLCDAVVLFLCLQKSCMCECCVCVCMHVCLCACVCTGEGKDRRRTATPATQLNTLISTRYPCGMLANNHIKGWCTHIHAIHARAFSMLLSTPISHFALLHIRPDFEASKYHCAHDPRASSQLPFLPAASGAAGKHS